MTSLNQISSHRAKTKLELTCYRNQFTLHNTVSTKNNTITKLSNLMKINKTTEA